MVLMMASVLLAAIHTVLCLPACLRARSMSLKLAHDIGYWDTFPDAIGEDMHMYIKVFMRTHGAARLYPLHAPINMCHVQGANWVGSIWARFMQVRSCAPSVCRSL
jgi:hypothetical protein